jgi:hypothetical protein
MSSRRRTRSRSAQADSNAHTSGTQCGCRSECHSVNEAADLFREWRTADRAAHAFEQELIKSSLKALEGLGEAPAAQEKEKAHELRRTANDLFHLAMVEMKRAAEMNRR